MCMWHWVLDQANKNVQESQRELLTVKERSHPGHSAKLTH